MTNRDTPDSDDPNSAPVRGGGAFPTTHWSMIVQAGSESDSRARAPLETLCRRYWFPLYGFARRQGRTHHEAEDATQEFLAQLLGSKGLHTATPERGRFRTFLLAGLRNFLTSDWRREHAAKRGGHQPVISLSATNAQAQFEREQADHGFTPEQAFDRSWAQSMIADAVRELGNEYRRTGREEIFQALAPMLWGDATLESMALQAGRAGMTVGTFTVALHRARRRLGSRLRAAVAETVADPAEIDAELRHLVGAFDASRRRR